MILLFFLSIVLNVFANIMLKNGVVSQGGFVLESSRLLSEILRVAKNPFIWAGLISYGVSFTIWLRILTLVDISRAYPIFATFVFLLTTLGSLLFLKEVISPIRILGILIMLLGIYLAARF